MVRIHKSLIMVLIKLKSKKKYFFSLTAMRFTQKSPAFQMFSPMHWSHIPVHLLCILRRHVSNVSNFAQIHPKIYRRFKRSNVRGLKYSVSSYSSNWLAISLLINPKSVGWLCAGQRVLPLVEITCGKWLIAKEVTLYTCVCT